MNQNLLKQKDWSWNARDGLITSKKNRVLVKNKNLILIAHQWSINAKSKPIVQIIQPIDDKITLEMLSSALFKIIPKGSDEGLLEMKVDCENEYSIVVFIGFYL